MTKASPMLIIHASLASGIPCWVGKRLPCLRMPGVLAYRPSRPPENAASPAPATAADDRQQQGRAEGDLAYREQPGEVRRLELVHERVGAGREPVQLRGGLLVRAQLADARVEDERPRRDPLRQVVCLQ